jgi:hypothetical protein
LKRDYTVIGFILSTCIFRDTEIPNGGVGGGNDAADAPIWNL